MYIKVRVALLPKQLFIKFIACSNCEAKLVASKLAKQTINLFKFNLFKYNKHSSFII